MEISIILPVYNHLDFTRVTLAELSLQLQDCSLHKFHIILVDDGSDDGTSNWVNTHYPEITVLKGDGNLWWSGAVNLGSRYAFENLHADYVILWNNDIHAENNYFVSLTQILTENDPSTIIGSKIYIAEQPSLIWSMGGYFKPLSGEYGMFGYFEENSQEFNQIKHVDWLTGMGTIVPREIVEKIGYWDNLNFPQYHGDSDFTYRAKRAGFKVIVHPSLVLFNAVKNSGIEHEGSIKKLFQLMTDIRSKSNLRKNFKFYRLYATSFRAFVPLIWLYVQIFGGFIKWKLLSLFGKKK
jgi:GT2 family glycosyltransferase